MQVSEQYDGYLPRNMESGKILYRRLAKQYHPDLATSLSEKPIHAKLMGEINAAHARGDIETLREIDSMGLTYLLYKFYAGEQESSASVDAPAQEYPCQAPRRPRSRFGNVSRGILRALYPYSLLLVINEWNETSRIRKLFAFFVSAIWSCAFYKIWGLLGVLSAWLVSTGHPHESVFGLGVVLMRGVLILIALPCIGPLCLYGVTVFFFLTIAYFVTRFASHLLAIFHPMLACLPPLVAVPVLLWFGWAILGDE